MLHRQRFVCTGSCSARSLRARSGDLSDGPACGSRREEPAGKRFAKKLGEGSSRQRVFSLRQRAGAYRRFHSPVSSIQWSRFVVERGRLFLLEKVTIKPLGNGPRHWKRHRQVHSIQD